jgi:hypothetical protein
MPIKKITKKPSVVVETKKMCNDCGPSCGCRMGHLFVILLLAINTILLICLFCRQTKIEADRVGGKANYKLVQQIYKTPAFQAQQKQQLEQALKLYQGGGQAQPTTTTTATQ